MFRPEAVVIHPSRYALLFGALFVFLCAISVSTADISGFAVAFFLVMVFFAARLLSKYVFLMSHDSIVEVVWKESGWWLTQKNGQVIEVEISPAAVVTGRFSLLCFLSLGDNAKMYRVLLFPDSAAPETLRRLRVCVLQAL